MLAGFAFTGCDNLLDAVPKDRLTEPSFFKSESELKAFAIVFYGNFPNPGELYEANDDHYTQNNLSAAEMGTRTIPASASDASWNWGALRNINTLLEDMYNCPDAVARTKYEALARFFRAYFYFEKVKRFGDVPWFDSTVGSADIEKLNRPRDNREFVMGKILEDLDFAIANLPTDKNVYEVTKWSAMAFKSRVCLFEGTFRKYHAGDVFLSTIPAGSHDYKWYLDECAAVSLELIQTGGYSLHTDGGATKSYYNLFHTMNATDLADEVILAEDYNISYSKYHYSGAVMTGGSRGCPSMTKKLVASYLMKDGTRFTDQAGWETMEFAAETQNRDPRLAQSIRTPGYKRVGEENTTSPKFLVTFSGYHPDKYLMGADQDTYSEIDLILFRLGEVMLNYAEAKAEAGTLDQSDLELSINQLRARVGMPKLNMAAANANPDPFLFYDGTAAVNEWGGYQSPVLLADANKGVILEIRRERGIELAQEGYRYYDLMRWKEGKLFECPFRGIYIPAPGVYDIDGNGTKDIEIYTDAKTDATAEIARKLGSDVFLSDSQNNKGFISLHHNTLRNWNEDKDYLYPIPTDERDLTDGALTQNPGWNDNLTFNQ